MHFWHLGLSDSIAVISCAFSVLVVLVTGIVTWKAMNKQIAASLRIAKQQQELSLQIAKEQQETSIRIAHEQVIAPMRQKWINDLREMLAEYIGLATQYSIATATKQSMPDGDYKRFIGLSHQIALMLNRGERDHAELAKAISSLLTVSTDLEKYKIGIKKIAELSPAILKREWNRVKAGDLQPVNTEASKAVAAKA